MHHSSIAGLVTIHSAPTALRQHIEWGLNALLGQPLHYSWRDQPLAAGTIRTTLEYRGDVGLASKIATALKNWHYLRFEVQEFGKSGSLCELRGRRDSRGSSFALDFGPRRKNKQGRP